MTWHITHQRHESDGLDHPLPDEIGNGEGYVVLRRAGGPDELLVVGVYRSPAEARHAAEHHRVAYAVVGPSTAYAGQQYSEQWLRTTVYHRETHCGRSRQPR